MIYGSLRYKLLPVALNVCISIQTLLSIWRARRRIPGAQASDAEDGVRGFSVRQVWWLVEAGDGEVLGGLLGGLDVGWLGRRGGGGDGDGRSGGGWLCDCSVWAMGLGWVEMHVRVRGRGGARWGGGLLGVEFQCGRELRRDMRTGWWWRRTLGRLYTRTVGSIKEMRGFPKRRRVGVSL